MPTQSKLPAVQIVTLAKATRAENDEQLLESWVANLTSPHSRRNFEVTVRRFLTELPAGGLRAATVEDVRDALGRITRDVSEGSGRQYLLRVKSLLGYAHRLGYAPFNAGATIKVRSDARNSQPQVRQRWLEGDNRSQRLGAGRRLVHVIPHRVSSSRG
jgi:integrase/recombinase XerD